MAMFGRVIPMQHRHRRPHAYTRTRIPQTLIVCLVGLVGVRVCSVPCAVVISCCVPDGVAGIPVPGHQARRGRGLAHRPSGAPHQVRTVSAGNTPKSWARRTHTPRVGEHGLPGASQWVVGWRRRTSRIRRPRNTTRCWGQRPWFGTGQPTLFCWRAGVPTPNGRL